MADSHTQWIQPDYSTNFLLLYSNIQNDKALRYSWYLVTVLHLIKHSFCCVQDKSKEGKGSRTDKYHCLKCKRTQQRQQHQQFSDLIWYRNALHLSPFHVSELHVIMYHFFISVFQMIIKKKYSYHTVYKAWWFLCICFKLKSNLQNKI